MSTFDIFSIVILILVSVRAALRGFVDEAGSTMAFLLSFALAWVLFKNGAKFLVTRGIITANIIPEIISFVVIFAVVFVGIKLLAYILKDIITRLSLDMIDHIVGWLFGIVEAVVLIAVFLFILEVQPVFDSYILLENSFFAKLLKPNTEFIQKTLGSINV